MLNVAQAATAEPFSLKSHLSSNKKSLFLMGASWCPFRNSVLPSCSHAGIPVFFLVAVSFLTRWMLDDVFTVSV